MAEENRGFFDGNPKMIFLFGLVAGIAITMIFSGVLPAAGGGSKINEDQVAVVDDSGDDDVAQKAPAVLSPITEDDHYLGNLDAPVVIIEYSDFECPFCERHHPTMEQLYDTYGDDMVWVYRHFPLSFHPEAAPAALASECAAEQDAFWEFADAMFDNQDELGDDFYLETAIALGLDEGQFTDCYESEKYNDDIAADYNSGVAAGVTGTPATYINGEKVSGAVPLSTLSAIVESYLTK